MNIAYIVYYCNSIYSILLYIAYYCILFTLIYNSVVSISYSFTQLSRPITAKTKIFKFCYENILAYSFCSQIWTARVAEILDYTVDMSKCGIYRNKQLTESASNVACFLHFHSLNMIVRLHFKTIFHYIAK